MSPNDESTKEPESDPYSFNFKSIFQHINGSEIDYLHVDLTEDVPLMKSSPEYKDLVKNALMIHCVLQSQMSLLPQKDILRDLVTMIIMKSLRKQ